MQKRDSKGKKKPSLGLDMNVTASATDRTKEQQLHLVETCQPRGTMIDGGVRRKRAQWRGAEKVKGKLNKNNKEGQKKKKHTSLTGWQRAHLSDGSAELTLEDFLQRLELVAGDVARLLQLLQQLYRPGDIWQGGGDAGKEQKKQNKPHIRNVCKEK